MNQRESVAVSVGQGSVALKRLGQSSPIVAEILGVETLEDGRRRIVLDRLVHRPHESTFDGWTVSGAVVTELSECVRPSAADERRAHG